MKVNVSIYGLSTEGYYLASILSSNGANVSIIDELKMMAINVPPSITMSYPNVETLIEEDTLLKLEHQAKTIQNADYIFFAPKIRKIGQEAKDEMTNKFKNAIMNINKDTSLIFNLPLGFGMNQEFIEILERFTGSEINYHYMPLGLYSSLIGSNKVDERLLKLLNNVDNKLQVLDVESAEIVYISKILSHYLSLISSFEAYKNSNQIIEIEEARELYIDDIASSLFDLRMISLSMQSSTPLAYLINGSIKSVENYTKYLIDKIKKIIRRLELRSNNIKIYLIWSMDKYEMRGDRIFMSEILKSKIEENITEVKREYINRLDDKIPLVISCSRYDYNNLKEKGVNDAINIKANPFCEMLKD